MPDDKTIFLVYNPGWVIENVILIAVDREDAKRQAHPILKANPDNYVVQPITNHAKKTVFMLNT